MSDFASLVDGGRRLAPLLADAVERLPGVVLLAAIPNGVPVALGAAETLAVDVSGLAVQRSAAGASVPARPDLAGRHVVVVDDGVETGTVARAAAASLREVGVASLRLAVPVCPREAEADLQHRYDEVIAVVRPLARRALAWHYRDFDTIDVPTAERLLLEHTA